MPCAENGEKEFRGENMIQVAAFHLTKNIDEAFLACCAYQVGGSVHVYPTVALHEESALYSRLADSKGWEAYIRKMKTRGLDKAARGEYEVDILDGLFVGRVGFFEQITGPVIGDSKYPHPSFLDKFLWAVANREAALEIEDRWYKSGALKIVSNPAFDFLRSTEEYADDVYLKSLWLMDSALRKKLDSDNVIRASLKAQDEEKAATAAERIKRAFELARHLPPTQRLWVRDVRSGKLLRLDRQYAMTGILDGRYALEEEALCQR